MHRHAGGKKNNAARDVKTIWLPLRGKIQRSLREFQHKGKKGSEQDLFAELVFCLFTPQSSARSCWATVETLRSKDLLLRGRKERLSSLMNRVRFRHNKAGYVIRARALFVRDNNVSLRSRIFGFQSARVARDWLVRNVKGLGYKEASHFLRNIGRGRNLAILDRHILKNLKQCGVIPVIPLSLSRKTYLAIEEKMAGFARETGVPLSHLDLLFWCAETGEIFK